MVSRDPTSIATFWVMRDFDIALSALPDVARVPNLKGGHQHKQLNEMTRADSNGYLYICVHTDVSTTLSTLPDVGRLPKFMVASTTSGFGGRRLEFL